MSLAVYVTVFTEEKTPEAEEDEEEQSPSRKVMWCQIDVVDIQYQEVQL